MKLRAIIFTGLLASILSSFMLLHKDLNEYGKWLEYHKLKDENFSQTGKTVGHKIQWYVYVLSKEQRTLFSSFFIYSPDSTYFIDLDTYSMNLEKDKNGQLISSGHKGNFKVQLVKGSTLSAASLLDPKTTCYPETAIWRNDTWLEIFGFKVDQDGKHIPTTWKFDVRKMLFTEYSNKEKFNKLPNSYAKNVRLKKIRFQ